MCTLAPVSASVGSAMTRMALCRMLSILRVSAVTRVHRRSSAHVYSIVEFGLFICLGSGLAKGLCDCWVA